MGRENELSSCQEKDAVNFAWKLEVYALGILHPKDFALLIKAALSLICQHAIYERIMQMR